MSLGASILNVLGNEDPREALLRSIAGASAAATGDPGVQPPAAAGGAPGTAAAAPGSGSGVQPSGYESPPDLSALYSQLMKFQRREDNINRGFGLIGAGIAKPENRANVLSAFGGDQTGYGRDGLNGMGNTIMEMTKLQAAQRAKAAGLANIPAIAQRYGLSPETALYLYETGKLDAVIAEAEKPNSELRELGNGVVTLIDKNTGEQRATYGDPKTNVQMVQDPERGTVGVNLNDPSDAGRVLAGPDNRTNDTKNYAAYVKDETDAGRVPLSFNDWDLQSKKAGASQTNVNMPGQNDFAKESAKYFAEDYQTMRKARTNAREMMNQYNIVEQALETGIRTGAWGEAEQSLRKVGAAIGLDTDPEKVAAGELIKTVTNRMALLMRNPESGMGMPGSVSDRDIQFLKDAQVGLSQSPQGNKAMLDIFKRMEKRKIEIANLADDYVKKHQNLDAGFDAVVADFAEKNPIFADFDLSKYDVDGGAARDRENELLNKYRKK